MRDSGVRARVASEALKPGEIGRDWTDVKMSKVEAGDEFRMEDGLETFERNQKSQGSGGNNL